MIRTVGNNPWGLTEREEEVMEAMCTLYSAKAAASALYVEPKTIEVHVQRIRRKMNLNVAGGRLEHFLLWDRFRRPGRQQ